MFYKLFWETLVPSRILWVGMRECGVTKPNLDKNFYIQWLNL